MTEDLQVVVLLATSAGFMHTLIGPDHYLPFIMIGKARNWKLVRTLTLTLICGVGHILSSIILGLVGVFWGLGLEKLEFIETSRGNLAAWALIAFGLIYAVWGLRMARKKKTHTHMHQHNCGVVHTHEHDHLNDHSHIHATEKSKKITPWVLFIIFVLGPCEVLIPLMMYPAAKSSFGGILSVTLAFSFTTLLTMLTAVGLGSVGISFLPTKKIGLYTHTIAGTLIFFSGLAIQVLGI